MTLPADVARCPGYQADGEWREGCEDCMRRTAAPVDPQRRRRPVSLQAHGRETRAAFAEAALKWLHANPSA